MNGEVRIGCAGWSIPRESAGRFSSEGSHLVRYARVLNCAEINSSFYRPHRESTWERWRESVPKDFRFSVKAPKAITHEAELCCSPEVLEGFLLQVHILGTKLGPLLFQLPPSLQFDRRTARGFCRLLRQRFAGTVALEPRHASWFHEDVSHLLASFEIARVAADPACIPEAALPGGWQKTVYFRLHGSPRKYYSSYEPRYLEGLSERTRMLSATADVWCIFDNTASGAAIQNALEVRSRMTAGAQL
jgi:uncharacterized protein YecE (DUF72 family)